MVPQIPLIFVHRGHSFYLYFSLRQACLQNKNSPVILLGTDDQPLYTPEVHYHNIRNFMSSAEVFEKHYIHCSSNPYAYELFCFQRWFIIRDFVNKHNFDFFVCCDTDVMFYTDISEIFREFIDCDLTVCNKNGPQYSFLTKKSINDFCNFMLTYYTVRKDRIIDMWNEYRKKQIPGGVCDMTLLELFSMQPHIKSFDLINYKKAQFDSILSASDGFIKKGDYKYLKMKRGIPHGYRADTQAERIFYALHFQGSAKRLIHRFYTGKDLFLYKCRRELYLIFFYLKHILKTILKKRD